MATGEEWITQVGKVWASNVALTDRAFSSLTQRLLERIATLPGDAILDVGCGAGELALSLAQARPAAMVTGLDISPDLIQAARHRAGESANARFALGDASAWQVPADAPPVDLLVSRHGVMFFDDPVSAFRNLLTQSARGARMVFSCFRDVSENPWVTGPMACLGLPAIGDPEAPGPFAFADEERVRAILSRAGWRTITAERVDFPYVVGMGEGAGAQALEFFRRIGPSARALRDMGEDQRTRAVEALRSWIARQGEERLVALAASAWIFTAIRG